MKASLGATSPIQLWARPSALGQCPAGRGQCLGPCACGRSFVILSALFPDESKQAMV